MAKQKSSEQDVVSLIEDVIDKGASTAEEVTRSVMELPVKVLEGMELGDSAEKVKNVSDTSIGAIYDCVRTVNQRVAELAADLLASRNREEDDN